MISLLSRRSLLALTGASVWSFFSKSARAQAAEASSDMPPAPNLSYADADPSALEDFRPTLDPYGAWVDDPSYGMVWVPDPSSAPGFAPYLTSGHWALTAGGDWIWVSDYPFGWVVFHYGRWVWIESLGWAWIPGRRYATAWVVWRVGDEGWDYVGWAPMPPTFIWLGGVAVVYRFGAPLPFVFCHSHHVFDRDVSGHIVATGVRPIAGHTRRWHVPPASTHIGPPLGTAHVPASARPITSAAPDARALAASRPVSVRPAPPRHPPFGTRTLAQPSAPLTISRPSTAPPPHYSMPHRPRASLAPRASAAPSPPRVTPRPATRAPSVRPRPPSLRVAPTGRPRRR